MGKRQNKRKNNQENKKTRDRDGKSDYVKKDQLENKDFEEYYRRQNILSENDFESFLAYSKIPLPISFRITGSRKHAFDLLEFMKSKVLSKIENVVIDGEQIKPPHPLPWYPDDLGWTFEIGRTAMRRSADIRRVQNFLVSETEIGNISRQEAVSMIPPLLLDVQPGHTVLDMCAAPGSKTTQLLEALLAEEDCIPKGLVIANDADHKRACMLVHQAKRLQTPCLIVTNHPAQEFPKILLENEKVLQFDRILCDVPCSGDGTVRKNRMIFKTWNVSSGNGLHKLQRDILLRACNLVKSDGVVVYSTCTFNPIENEAVVASVLAETKGAFELVDVSKQLPGLKRMPGMSSWTVKKNGKFYDSFIDGEQVPKTMFPPENIGSLNIERCVRIYPFLQNTGGFFIAVLRKVGPFGSIDRKADRVAMRKRELEDLEEDGSAKKVHIENEGQSQRAGWEGEKELPFLFLSSSNETSNMCCESFGLSPLFPRNLFLVRSDEYQGDFRHIYMTTEKARDVLTAKNANSLKIVNVGVKIFTKTTGKASEKSQFRLCNEGLGTVTSYIEKEKLVRFSLEDLAVMAKIEYPKFDEFSEQGRATLASLGYGTFVLCFDPSLEKEHTYEGSMTCAFYAPFLRSHTSCSLLLDKAEKRSLLCRLTGEELEHVQVLGLSTLAREG